MAACRPQNNNSTSRRGGGERVEKEEERIDCRVPDMVTKESAARDMHSPPFVGGTNKRARNVTYGRRESFVSKEGGKERTGTTATAEGWGKLCGTRAGGTWKNVSRHVPPVDGAA